MGKGRNKLATHDIGKINTEPIVNGRYDPYRRSLRRSTATASAPRRKKDMLKVDLDEDTSMFDSMPTLKKIVPLNDLHDISSIVSRITAEKRPRCIEEEVLVLRDETPPCLLIVTHGNGKAVKNFGNALARELTSVLQSKIPYSICIVPVFLGRQQLPEALTVMEKTLAKVKPFVPYGRWMMMPPKKNSFVTALKTI